MIWSTTTAPFVIVSAATTNPYRIAEPPKREPPRFPTEQEFRAEITRMGLSGRACGDAENPVAIYMRWHGCSWNAWATDTHWGDDTGIKEPLPAWASRLIIRCRAFQPKKPHRTLTTDEVLQLMDEVPFSDVKIRLLRPEEA